MAHPLSQPSERFTYADYVVWPGEERWELIQGVPCAMSPAPSRRHQEVLGALHALFFEALRGKPCRVYSAPFDVRLPRGEESDESVDTVVQPDLSVVCDRRKLDDRGCRGAPDLVAEVTSPATAARDQIEKLALYERHGVREYWLVHPTDRLVTVFRLGPDGTFGRPAVHSSEGRVPVDALGGLEIDLREVFAE